MKVSVKALVVKSGKILLLKSRPGEGIQGWDGPGGWVEKGETFLQALKREVKEETGLELDKATILTTLNLPQDPKHYLIYLCTVKEGKIVISKEHRGYQWVSLKEAEKLTGLPIRKEIQS